MVKLWGNAGTINIMVKVGAIEFFPAHSKIIRIAPDTNRNEPLRNNRFSVICTLKILEMTVLLE